MDAAEGVRAEVILEALERFFFCKVFDDSSGNNIDSKVSNPEQTQINRVCLCLSRRACV